MAGAKKKSPLNSLRYRQEREGGIHFHSTDKYQLPSSVSLHCGYKREVRPHNSIDINFKRHTWGRDPNLNRGRNLLISGRALGNIMLREET